MTINVMTDYGAKNDGVTNDTTCFQNALNAAGAKGDTVYCPPGTGYYFAGHLSVPEGVTLQGGWNWAPSWIQAHLSTYVPGTMFLVTDGSGQANGTPFLTLSNDAAVCGISFNYPNQITGSGTPVIYPYTIATASTFTTGYLIENLELRNSYQGLNIGGGGRAVVRNIVGQPLLAGIQIDNCTDIIRLENVHFNEYWNNALASWTKANASAFIVGRADAIRFHSCFCEEYLNGFLFVSTGAGNAYGAMTDCETDTCTNGVVIQSCNTPGISIVGGDLWGSTVALSLASGFTGRVSVCGAQLGLVEVKGGSLAMAGCRFDGTFNPNVNLHTGATLVQSANIGIQVANVP